MKQRLQALLLLLIVCALFPGMPLSAQSTKRDEKIYRESAAAIGAGIWAMDLPQFRNYTVPEEHRTRSSVILARYIDLNAGSKRGVRRSNTRITIFFRQLVLLNDAIALKEYSTFSFTQFQKGNGYNLNNKTSVFIGAHIIKPDNRVIDVSSEDVVFTADEKSKRDVKLALPDLQVGDKVDAYVVLELDIDEDAITSLPFVFQLYDDIPVCQQSVHCVIGKKYAAEYRSHNGAPEFRHTVDEEGNNVLDVSTDKVLYVPDGTLWTAPPRQFPAIRLNIVKGDLAPYTSYTRRRAGNVYPNQDAGKFVRDDMIALNRAKYSVLQYCQAMVGRKSSAVAAYYDSLRLGGTLHEDSAAAELYYMFRFDLMFNWAGKGGIESIAAASQTSLVGSVYAYLLSEYFKHHGLKSEMILTSSSSGPRMNELMSTNEIFYLCNVRKNHDAIFGISSYYSPAFYIPAALEGSNEAVAVDTKGTKSVMATDYTQRPIATARSVAADNVHYEQLTIMPDLANNNIYVTRMTSLTGHCKEGIQQDLLLIEDFYDYERRFYNEDRSLTERIGENNRSLKGADEWSAAVDQARKDQQAAFLTEAGNWLDAEITNMTSASVINPGVRHTSPAFEYGSAFLMYGVLKEGGSNYILEVGRLAGKSLHVADSQRHRTFDIFMPYAHTTHVLLTIRVPDGYKAEGLATLNRTVSNSAGYFKATASIERNYITIVLERVFNKAHYPVTEWPAILNVIDAESEWKGARLLFRKKEI